MSSIRADIERLLVGRLEWHVNEHFHPPITARYECGCGYTGNTKTMAQHLADIILISHPITAIPLEDDA